MSEKLVIWTLDWVPDGPRGFVRDLRLRRAAEEAGLSYEVRTVPFDGRDTNHLDRQPFGQVPFLTDGEVSMIPEGTHLPTPLSNRHISSRTRISAKIRSNSRHVRRNRSDPRR